MARPSVRTLGYLAGWLGAAALAVAVGLFAVTGVGASVRDRGPLNGQQRAFEAAGLGTPGAVTPDPAAERREQVFDDDFGSITVACRGAVAYGVEAAPAPGWTTIGFEPGPDDDVDAVFSSGARSIELEVYCNGGRPTLSDREDQTLGDGD
ncbi:hypothetical protein [Nocardioides dongxiaopingii]|uniref:hypothetical protein n=1 Tax=Nocardioides dongxiaopingii TaxID=2576036 RepID=UPI0010C76332|nr:hypothetical protein [Nocardioides dongxiaopingii]